MATSNTYVRNAVVRHELRSRWFRRWEPSPYASADLALLRVVLGLPADAEVRWSACR